MKPPARSVAIRMLAAALLIAGFSAGVRFIPNASAIGPAVAFAEASGSVPASSTADTSTPVTTAPKTKSVDTRPVAPKFVPRKGKAVYVDRRKQRVYLYVKGRQIDTFRCSTSTTLPRRGTYHLRGKRRQSWSFTGGLTFYWQVIFTVGPHGHNIAFHSIPVNSSGREIAPVGSPVSHGCVRLPYNKAKFLYFWITSRTPIIVRA